MTANAHPPRHSLPRAAPRRIVMADVAALLFAAGHALPGALFTDGGSR